MIGFLVSEARVSFIDNCGSCDCHLFVITSYRKYCCISVQRSPHLRTRWARRFHLRASKQELVESYWWIWTREVQLWRWGWYYGCVGWREICYGRMLPCSLCHSLRSLTISLLCHQQTSGGRFGRWWDTAKVLWRYGWTAPSKTQSLYVRFALGAVNNILTSSTLIQRY